MMQRRGLLAGLSFLAAAPAIIRTPGLLMPVRVERPEPFMVVLVNGPDGVRRRYTQDKPIEFLPDGDGCFRNRLTLPWGALPMGMHEVSYQVNIPGFPTIKGKGESLYSIGTAAQHYFDFRLSA